MANSVEKTGKTVDAAVFAALEALGATIDEVIVEVLEEGEGGILGIGRKPARVLVTLDRLDDSLSLPADDAVGEDTQYDFSPEEINAADFTDPGMFADEELIEDMKIEAVQTGSESAVYYGDDSDYLDNDSAEASQRAVDYVRAILDSMDIAARISTAKTEDGLQINVQGDDVGAVIGRRGDTLNALQYLTSLVVNRESEKHLRVYVDIADYRKRRERQLAELAERTAKKVLKVGKEYVMEVMPAAERRVIHATLQDYPGIQTASEGQEPHRYVVVIPLKKSGAGR